MSTNEMSEHDNPFAWAMNLGTEEATGEGDTGTSTNGNLYSTEAFFDGRDPEAYQARPSSGHSLGTLGPTSPLDSDAASAVPELVSGCRIIEEKEPRSRRKIDPKVVQGNRFVCLWTPCKSSRTFGREAELQRHYTDQHVRPKAYHCTAFAYSGRCNKEYYRLDKLQYHLEKEHPQEMEFFCPIPTCNAGPYTLDLLRVHVVSHDGVRNRRSSGLARWFFDFEGYPLFCPVKDCGTKLNSTRVLRDHLPSHDATTRANNREAIRSAGYSELNCHPLCPICGDSIDIGKGWEFIVIEGTEKREYVTPIESHMFHCHWHEPEMLHKHRRDILRIDPYNFPRTSLIQNKVFKDVLATNSARK